MVLSTARSRGRAVSTAAAAPAVSAAAAPERALRYAPQLEAYAWAMSRVTGLPVKRRVVCFLASGASVEL